MKVYIVKKYDTLIKCVFICGVYSTLEKATNRMAEAKKDISNYEWLYIEEYIIDENY